MPDARRVWIETIFVVCATSRPWAELFVLLFEMRGRGWGLGGGERRRRPFKINWTTDPITGTYARQSEWKNPLSSDFGRKSWLNEIRDSCNHFGGPWPQLCSTFAPHWHSKKVVIRIRRFLRCIHNVGNMICCQHVGWKNIWRLCNFRTPNAAASFWR